MPRMQHNGATLGGYVSAADYSGESNQYLAVVRQSEGVAVLGTGKTADPLGVIWSNEGGSGAGLAIIPAKDGDVIPMRASAAISAGAEVTLTAGGKIVTNDATAGNRIVGIAEEAAGADNDIIGVMISKGTQE